MSNAPAGLETLYGLVSFDHPLDCSRDVLGCKTPVAVGGVEGILELPGPAPWGTERPDDPLHVPLLAPVRAASWKVGQNPLVWGFPVHYPEGTARVDKALLTFELPAIEMRRLASRVHGGFASWYRLFEQFYELLTLRRRPPGIEVTPNPSQLDLFRWTDGGSEHPYDADPLSITIMMSDDRATLLRPEQFADVCALASAGRQPALPYRVQLEAYRALTHGDFRKAIVEAASAAELALTTAARELLLHAGIGYADEIMKRYSALGGKLDLARTVGVPLPPEDYVAKLVNPRNAVIHRGEDGGRAVAYEAVEVADRLLRATCASLVDPVPPPSSADVDGSQPA